MHRGHGKLRILVPKVWLLSDERVAEAELMRAIARLPLGSAVVLRHYRLAETDRHALFQRVRKAARRRHCKLLLAGPPRIAREWGADGHHGPERRPALRSWLHSVSAHDPAELKAAQRLQADAAFLSPLFATRSHPGARFLGPVRFAALARLARLPVIALGGVHPRHALGVRQLGAVGFAAIDGLTAPLGCRQTCERGDAAV